jgi:ATP-dependent RNA helicase SUPV3L1/SUV3
MSAYPDDRGRVLAVLGPTNTGKTHLAVERMLARPTGIIGLPLRLLAREIYDRVVRAKGEAATALVTGEEKIVPKTARYFICTAEAMPLSRDADFVAIDEVQLAADPERGHIFTDRLLYTRGREETMLLGAGTMGGLIRTLVPNAELDGRERFSQLTYTGPTKLTRLPRRSAVVAFSAESVYAIAELLRRRRGGAAVVMGGLSPRTRNAQVELFQSGEVDFLVATDAIGMGLNMDIDHVAFAESRKFDGRKRRALTPAELAQIAGRAGRFRSDGTFGETAECRAFDPDTVAAIESHRFAPVEKLQWRNPDLDETSLAGLLNSLAEPSPDRLLERAREAIDELTLAELARDREITQRATTPAIVARLWDACRLPDFRRATLDAHARLVKTIFLHLTTGNGRLPDTWLAGQLERLNKTGGDVDTLAARLAHVRTWAYAAHRSDWTNNPAEWRQRAREIEDALSDALHERLMQRFVDRRTSALVRGMRDERDMLAGISADGDVTVEGHYVGHLEGLVFKADAQGSQLEARTVRSVAMKSLQPELNRRLSALAEAQIADIEITDAGEIVWQEAVVARLVAGTEALRPKLELEGGEAGAQEAQLKARTALEALIAEHIQTVLAPIFNLRDAANREDTPGPARGLAWRLHEAGGAIARHTISDDIHKLLPEERRVLRAVGVRIGEHMIYVPALVKPAAARLNALLRAIAQHDLAGVWIPPAGLTSLANDKARSRADQAACGFYPCGPRSVRFDMLERLADAIRDARKVTKSSRFPPSAEMTALLGCSVEDLRGVLTALGYRRLQIGPDPEKAEGELWGPRKSRTASTKPKAKAKPKAQQKAQAKKAQPPDPDNPFAILAGLNLPAAKQPAKRPRRAKTARPAK